MRTKKSLLFALTLVLFFSFVTALYAAQADIDFYKGKVLTYVVATKPGGGYDAYARLIGKYMEKNIPGVTLVIKNIPGAGHIIGANETFFAKPDGLIIGTFNTGLIFSQIVGLEGIKFDLTKYSWIGKANAEARVFIVGTKTRFNTFKDILDSKEPIKMPSSGVGSQDHNETMILKEALPANFKAIPGYAGREGEMAIMRGDCEATIGSYTGLLGFINAKECRVLMQYGSGKKIPELGNVPFITEFQVPAKGKPLIDLINNVSLLGRLTAAPPGVPAGRLEVLRDAYKKAVTDPELIKEGEKVGLDFEPLYGDEVARLVTAAVNQPPENLKMLQEIIKPK